MKWIIGVFFSEENALLKAWRVINWLHSLQGIRLQCNDEYDISPCKHHIHLWCHQIKCTNHLTEWQPVGKKVKIMSARRLFGFNTYWKISKVNFTYLKWSTFCGKFGESNNVAEINGNFVETFGLYCLASLKLLRNGSDKQKGGQSKR